MYCIEKSISNVRLTRTFKRIGRVFRLASGVTSRQSYFLKNMAGFDCALHYITDSPFIRLDARPYGAETS